MSFHQNRCSESIQNLFHHQCQMTCLELNEMRNFRRQPCIRCCTMHIPTMRGAVVFLFPHIYLSSKCSLYRQNPLVPAMTAFYRYFFQFLDFSFHLNLLS